MPVRTEFSLKRSFVVAADAAVVLLAFLFAFLLRFDLRPEVLTSDIVRRALPVLILYPLAFRAVGLHRGVYYFSSFADVLNIVKAVAAAGAAAAFAILFLRQPQFPRSILILHPILTFLGVGGVRFGIRLGKSYLNMPRSDSGSYRRALLVGAGDCAESLVRQILRSRGPHYKIVGYVDDERGLWGKRLHGRPVFGGLSSLASVLDRQHVDEIIVAVDSRRGEAVRVVIETLRDRSEKPELRIAPSLDEMLTSRRSPAVRRIKPADLLNREVVRLDQGLISHSIAGKTVLVTGAGGTIGAELSKQVLAYRPAKIIVLESHATSLFYVESELRAQVGNTEILSVLGDIRDQVLVDRVFAEHKPAVVLHAAAHKHVHQLEFNVHEGVGNNIMGTFYMAKAARRYGADVFLLVSTDKAVNPTSVMGATKRVAELIVRSFARRSEKTRFVAVRFGNVLGSSGSVLEIFQQQIAKGGPITVTHPEATRYFMTVEEAVQLILQAGAMARGGEIFVLKMGTPVRILDMAKNLILLSGLEPEKDIEIKLTGLKQGEKLGEQLFEEARDCDDSEHPSIMVLKADGDIADIESEITELATVSKTSSSGQVLAKMRDLIPTFTPAALRNGAPLENQPS